MIGREVSVDHFLLIVTEKAYMSWGLVSQDMGGHGWEQKCRYEPRMARLGASPGWLATSGLGRLAASLERHPMSIRNVSIQRLMVDENLEDFECWC